MKFQLFQLSKYWGLRNMYVTTINILVIRIRSDVEIFIHLDSILTDMLLACVLDVEDDVTMPSSCLWVTQLAQIAKSLTIEVKN